MKKFSQLIILGISILMLSTACTKQVFNGSRSSNDTQFILDYSVMNCTKTQEMKLEEGTTVNVIIESNSGRVDILVEDAHREKIYKGDDADSGEFSLKIPKTDTYTFSVTGSNAKGSVSFKVAD